MDNEDGHIPKKDEKSMDSDDYRRYHSRVLGNIKDAKKHIEESDHLGTRVEALMQEHLQEDTSFAVDKRLGMLIDEYSRCPLENDKKKLSENIIGLAEKKKEIEDSQRKLQDSAEMLKSTFTTQYRILEFTIEEIARESKEWVRSNYKLITEEIPAELMRIRQLKTRYELGDKGCESEISEIKDSEVMRRKELFEERSADYESNIKRNKEELAVLKEMFCNRSNEIGENYEANKILLKQYGYTNNDAIAISEKIEQSYDRRTEIIGRYKKACAEYQKEDPDEAIAPKQESRISQLIGIGKTVYRTIIRKPDDRR